MSDTTISFRRDKQGWVYVLTSPANNYVKIGSTQRSPEDRARELSADTGVPQPYKVSYGLLTHEAEAVERAVHKSLASRRVNQHREFFTVSVVESLQAIEEAAGARAIEVGIWQGDWTRSSVEKMILERQQEIENGKNKRAEEARLQEVTQNREASEARNRELLANQAQLSEKEVIKRRKAMLKEVWPLQNALHHLNDPIQFSGLQWGLVLFSFLTLFPVLLLYNLYLVYTPAGKKQCMQRRHRLQEDIKIITKRHGF